MQKIIAQIAQEIRVQVHQVVAAVELLDGGATVPFIARYRKEVTGGLDDIQLRELEARLAYLRELRDRLQTVIKAIDEQGKLTPALLAALHAAATKQELEDLYLPFKLKRRTKGQLAREAGLEPLADALFANPTLVPADEALAYVIALRPVVEGEDKQPDFSTVPAVLDGVRDLLSERWAETPALVQDLREWLWLEGLLQSKLMAGKDENHADVAKFRDYFDYDEPIRRVPSHRALAVFRGRSLDILDAKLVLPEPELPASTAALKTRATPVVSLAEGRIALKLGWRHQSRPADDLIRKCVAWTWRVKLSLSTERDLFARLREEAERVAIKVFADNLRDLLLAAPAGPRVVMGLDPGIRTGVKVAVVDETGKVVDTATVYPHQPRNDWDGSLHTLVQLAKKHRVTLIAIGNGTASRETDKLAQDLIKLCGSADASSGRHSGEGRNPAIKAGCEADKINGVVPLAGESVNQLDSGLRRITSDLPACGLSRMASSSINDGGLKMTSIVVSEAGASVYSASEFASKELPELDVSLRGAVSIARRLQDPLAELVKIDPKSIGVGQYQHDVSQFQLARSLDAVVEDCVNAVGVDVNTASAPLLARVSGLNSTVAQNIVAYRDQQGRFATRQSFLDVPRLGKKAFEQAAGFLRIMNGANPLDASTVHPESYPLVKRILADIKQDIKGVIGNSALLKSLNPAAYVSEQFGIPTITDILKESLSKEL